jgi:hypothetical protein
MAERGVDPLLDRAIRITAEIYRLVQAAEKGVDDTVRDLRRAAAVERRAEHEEREGERLERRAESIEREALGDLTGTRERREWDDRRHGRYGEWEEGREDDWREDWPWERRWRWWYGQHEWAWREAHELQRLVGQLQRPGRRPEEWYEQHEGLYRRFGRFRDHLTIMRRQWEPWAHAEIDGMHRYADGWYGRWPEYRERGDMAGLQRMQHEMSQVHSIADGLRRNLYGRRYPDDMNRRVQYRY